MTVVNETTHSNNKIDFEKCKQSKQGLPQKKAAFQIAWISYAKGFLNMLMVNGLLY